MDGVREIPLQSLGSWWDWWPLLLTWSELMVWKCPQAWVRHVNIPQIKVIIDILDLQQPPKRFLSVSLSSSHSSSVDRVIFLECSWGCTSQFLFLQRTKSTLPEAPFGVASEILHDGFKFPTSSHCPQIVQARGGWVWVTHSSTHWISFSAFPAPETEDLFPAESESWWLVKWMLALMWSLSWPGFASLSFFQLRCNTRRVLSGNASLILTNCCSVLFC